MQLLKNKKKLKKKLPKVDGLYIYGIYETN